MEIDLSSADKQDGRTIVDMEVLDHGGEVDAVAVWFDLSLFGDDPR